MTGEKRRRIAEVRENILNIILVVILAIFIFCCISSIVSHFRYSNDIKELDAIELGFDADDIFLLVDKGTGVGGLYFGGKRVADFVATDENVEIMEKSRRKEVPWLIIETKEKE